MLELHQDELITYGGLYGSKHPICGVSHERAFYVYRNENNSCSFKTGLK